MSHERNLKYLNDHRIVYRQHPINDIPDQDNETRIIIAKLKPEGTVTTAPKYNK